MLNSLEDSDLVKLIPCRKGSKSSSDYCVATTGPYATPSLRASGMDVEIEFCISRCFPLTNTGFLITCHKPCASLPFHPTENERRRKLRIYPAITVVSATVISKISE